jgi:hypothetical protein
MMPTTDASNPVTSSVTTGAGQVPVSQQNPQSMDFDFDLDFSDTTHNPVSDSTSVDQDLQAMEPVSVQTSQEISAPDAHSDLDFSLDLPDSYTGDASENVSSVENVEDSQVVDQVSPVEVPQVDAHPEVSEPDFGSLLNEEQSPEPVSSEPVEAPVESALENDLEPVEEATTFQSEEQPAVADEEALESQEAANELTSEVVAEPIAEVDEEASEGLSDGESDLEFSPEDFEDDTLPMAEEDSFSEDDEETTPVFENEIAPEASGSMFSSEVSPIEEATSEMEEKSDFTLENQTEPSAFSSPYEGEVAQAEVQSFQPAEEVQVESTIDPFEAMKVSLEPENTVETQSSIQMSPENTTPMMENALHEEMSTVKNESYDAQTPVAPLVQNVDTSTQSFDTPMQMQVEQTQPSAFQQGMSLDTLAAQTPVQEVPQVQAVSEGHVAPQMLSLDEMLAQPAAQVPQQVAPVMDLTSLTVGAQDITNPLTNPTAYPTVQAAGNDGMMKKILAGVGGVVLVALAGVMVYIKYPLMFGSGADTPQQPTTQSGTLQSQLALNTSGDQADHFAAGQEGENTDQDTVTTLNTGDNQSLDGAASEVEVTSPIQEEEVEDVVLGGDEEVSSASGENSVSGLSTVSEQQKKTENTTLSGDSAPDALNSVEDLVGPVNSNDVLGQEIELYRQKAQQIADTGRAQNVRMMVKWGTAVAKQVEKIQQELANGGNMTISEWNQKKAELDISLAKATNE